MTTTAATTDIELVRQLKAGNADAFQALYRRYQGPVYRFALLRCGSADTAADIVQDVFLGLLTGSYVFDPLRGQLQAFLFGVARNLALKLDEAGRRTVSSTVDDEEDEGQELACDGLEPLKRLLHNELAEEVRRALAQLPPHYREPVILYEMHDLTYVEIAEICQVDIGTVRSRLSRARAALAKRLARETSDAA